MPAVKSSKNRFDSERELKVRIRELAAGPVQAALTGLIPILSSRERWAIREAVKGIGSLDPDDAGSAIPHLVELYLHLDGDGKKRDPLCDLRKSIVAALGTLRATDSIDIVRRAMRTVQIEPVGFGMEDTALDLRATAALVAAELATDTAQCLCDLGVMLFDMKPNLTVAHTDELFVKAATRRAAAKAISALGDPAGAALLVARISRADEELPEVLGDCMDALAVLRPNNLAQWLSAFLTCNDAYLVARAASALAQGLGEQALPILMKAFPTIIGEAAVPVVYAITGIRSIETGKALMSLISHDDEQVRIAAIEGVSLYSSSEVDEFLRKVIDSDSSANVRRAAKLALS